MEVYLGEMLDLRVDQEDLQGAAQLFSPEPKERQLPKDNLH